VTDPSEQLSARNAQLIVDSCNFSSAYPGCVEKRRGTSARMYDRTVKSITRDQLRDTTIEQIKATS